MVVNAENKVRLNVIQLTKRIGPSSSPWQNFYPNLRKRKPGMMFPLAETETLGGPVSIKRAETNGSLRRYFSGGFVGIAWLLGRISRISGRKLVVHVHSPILILLTLFARLLGSRFSIVVTQHNNWSSFRIHQRMCLWLGTVVASAYVPCGKQVGASLPASVRDRLTKRDRLHPIPNGIPSETLGKIAKDRHLRISGRHGDSKTSTIILAKMAPQKNCMHLLQLIAAIPDLGQVTWYGDGKMRPQLVEERARLGLEERVEFAGIVPREKIYKALTEHDFYLTASLWEGLSVADLEAVAIGCLPLMSDIPQRREIAEATDFNLLPQNDIQAWRDEVQRYTSMSARDRADHGLALSDRACEAFSLERMIDDYVKIYQQVVLK